MAQEKKDNRFNNIIKSLSSNKNEEVLTAIKQLRKHGKPEAIPHLLHLHQTTTNDEVINEITQFLFDLKDQSATETIINAIAKETNNSKKAFLISIFWQSVLDASDHLSFLVNQAIQGDYMVAVEAMTVIDNFETTFHEDEIMNIFYDLDEAIEHEEEDKKELLITFKEAIRSLSVEF
ncbi:MAG: hypothetical protein J5I47_05480 [Vicingus serpentipes]|nr:hypothetical protein [Vicingus serpentipes]